MATLLNIAPDGKDAFVVDIDLISFIVEEYDGDIFLFYKDSVSGAYFNGGDKVTKINPHLRTLIQESASEEFLFIHLPVAPDDDIGSPCVYYFPISSLQSFFTYKNEQPPKEEEKAHIEMRLSYFGRIESSTYAKLPYSKINRILNLIELQKELVHIPPKIATVSQIETSGCYLDGKQIKLIEIDPYYARVNFINNMYSLDFKLPAFNSLGYLERCQRETPDMDLNHAFDTLHKLEQRGRTRAIRNFLDAFKGKTNHLTEVPKAKYPTFLDVSNIFSIEHCEDNNIKLAFKDEKSRPFILQFKTINDAKAASVFLTECVDRLQNSSKKRKKLPLSLNP